MNRFRPGADEVENANPKKSTLLQDPAARARAALDV